MTERIEGIVRQRLDELTPERVKEIVEDMIRSIWTGCGLGVSVVVGCCSFLHLKILAILLNHYYVCFSKAKSFHRLVD